MSTVVQETHAEAMQRLLRVARESGVKLLRSREGDYFATSVSEPGRLYAVTETSCGCRGFASHGRCRHLAAYLEHQRQEAAKDAGIRVEHTPGGWVEDDINHTDRLRYRKSRTSIYQDGIEVFRISGDDRVSVVARPGTVLATDCADVLNRFSHYDETVRALRTVAPEADLAKLLGDAELFPESDVHADAFEPAVA